MGWLYRHLHVKGLRRGTGWGPLPWLMFYPNSSLYWVICAKILLSSLETSWCFALYREKTMELNLETNIGKMFQ